MPPTLHWHATLAALIPLERVGEVVNNIVLWWGGLVGHISPDRLPLYAYLGFSIIALLLWFFFI